MNKIQNKIEQADFKKIARRFIAAAIVFVVAAAVAGGLLLKTQIQEAYTLYQNKDKIVADARAADQGQSQKVHREKAEHQDQHKEERTASDHEVEWEDIVKEQITSPSTGTFIGLGILGAVGLAFGIVYWILIAAWLYKAAGKANMNRVLWFIAGIICNLAAIVIFLIVRSIMRITCENCGMVQKRQEFCSHCGAVLERKCDACMSKLGPDDVFCGRCGKKCSKEEQSDKKSEEKDQ